MLSQLFQTPMRKLVNNKHNGKFGSLILAKTNTRNKQKGKKEKISSNLKQTLHTKTPRQ